MLTGCGFNLNGEIAESERGCVDDASGESTWLTSRSADFGETADVDKNASRSHFDLGRIAYDRDGFLRLRFQGPHTRPKGYSSPPNCSEQGLARKMHFLERLVAWELLLDVDPSL